MACWLQLSVHDSCVLSLACCYVLSVHDRWSAFPERLATSVAGKLVVAASTQLQWDHLLWDMQRLKSSPQTPVCLFRMLACCAESPGDM